MCPANLIRNKPAINQPFFPFLADDLLRRWHGLLSLYGEQLLSSAANSTVAAAAAAAALRAALGAVFDDLLDCLFAFACTLLVSPSLSCVRSFLLAFGVAWV